LRPSRDRDFSTETTSLNDNDYYNGLGDTSVLSKVNAGKVKATQIETHKISVS